jgi:hypothetical protein
MKQASVSSTDQGGGKRRGMIANGALTLVYAWAETPCMATKTEIVLIRMAPELRAVIEIAAADERRSISDVIRGILLDWAVERRAERERQAA